LTSLHRPIEMSLPEHANSTMRRYQISPDQPKSVL
jgi:hypothetical protein